MQILNQIKVILGSVSSYIGGKRILAAGQKALLRRFQKYL